MKTRELFLTVGGLSLGLLWPAVGMRAAEAAGPATRVVVLQIKPEIDCPACEDKLKELLEKTKGVRRVEMDVMESRATVRFNPAECTVGRLVGRLVAVGYGGREVK